MLRTLPVNAELLGAVATGHVEAVAIWEDQAGRRVLTDRQERDETTGWPLWTVHAMVPTGDRPELLAIRVPAQQQPVVTAFGPIDLHGLEVNVRVDKAGKLAGYWSAVGVTDPAQAPGKRQSQDSKTEPAVA